MEVLAQNKMLRCLDLSCNNFIENQEAAKKADQTPYKIFKRVYEKWIKMGKGVRWPGTSILDNN